MNLFYQTMPLKIDFYLAETQSPAAYLTFCCHVLEHYFKKNNAITVLLSQTPLITELDAALWSVPRYSFLPHYYDEQAQQMKLYHLPCTDTPADTQCNMHTDHYELLPHIQQLIQIVPQDEQEKQKARLLYRHFQQLNPHIILHKETDFYAQTI